MRRPDNYQRNHYFASALVVADSVVNYGFSDRITRAVFEAIITRSAEMDSANQVLRAEKELADSKIMPPTLLGVSAEEIKAARPAAERRDTADRDMGWRSPSLPDMWDALS